MHLAREKPQPNQDRDDHQCKYIAWSRNFKRSRPYSEFWRELTPFRNRTQVAMEDHRYRHKHYKNQIQDPLVDDRAIDDVCGEEKVQRTRQSREQYDGISRKCPVNGCGKKDRRERKKVPGNALFGDRGTCRSTLRRLDRPRASDKSDKESCGVDQPRPGRGIRWISNKRCHPGDKTWKRAHESGVPSMYRSPCAAATYSMHKSRDEAQYRQPKYPRPANKIHGVRNQDCCQQANTDACESARFLCHVLLLKAKDRSDPDSSLTPERARHTLRGRHAHPNALFGIHPRSERGVSRILPTQVGKQVSRKPRSETPVL